MQQYIEEEIIKQLRDPAHQRDAFAQVVNFYGEKLYWQIRKMVLDHDDANDLLQNTFLKAWMNIDYFRGEAKLSTWLYKIAINECITFLNRQRVQNNVSIDDTDVFLLERLKGDEYFDGDAAQMKLQKAILTLPEKQRAVFNMKYFDDMKYEDMSDALNAFPYLKDDPEFYYKYLYNNNTDWQDLIYRNAFVTDNVLKIKGGDAIAKYDFSIGVKNKQGTVNINVKALANRHLPKSSDEEDDNTTTTSNNVKITVMVGSDKVYSQKVSRDTEKLNVTVEGKGNITVKVYIANEDESSNGILAKNATIDLNSENTVLNVD